MILLLLIVVMGACSKSKEPVDVSGKDAGSIVQEDISAILTDLPSHLKDIIIENEATAVQTSEDYFRKIAKTYIAGDVILYPQLTYRIKYRKSEFLNLGEAQCDAMAYSVIRDGKLYGDGLVLSQTVGWRNTSVIGYSEMLYSLGVDTIIFIAVALLLYVLYKLFIAKFGNGWSFMFKSKAERMYIGDSVTCAVCGRKYYKLKSSSIPFELIGKYYAASVVICSRCGRAYCSGGGISSCSVRIMMTGGCECSRGQRIELIAEAYVSKD
jgi:hypothetical protein